MRTTSKKYHVKIFLEHPIPGMAEDAVFTLTINAKSYQGALKWVRQNAEIISKLSKPICCTIEWNTEQGKKGAQVAL